jgi:cytochrome c oxidase cbb3-type subunit 4
MTIENIFDSASSIMTAVSFTVFLGILWWVFIHKRSADFDEVSRLPFADEEDVMAQASGPAVDRSARTSGAKPAGHTTEARHG